MLRIRMLGAFDVELDGIPLTPPESRRAWALLAWLALHPTAHHRAKLAARFWPDTLDASARANLRSAIWSLRRTLGAAGERHLAANRDSVGLIAEALWTDVGEFARLAAEGDLAGAVALCRGDLLPDLDDDWAYEAREEHRDRLARVLGGLAERAEQTGDAEAAVRHTRRQAGLLPLSEDVHRELIRRLAASGDRAGAMVAAERLRERFRAELGIELSEETRRLVQSIRAPGETRRPTAIAEPVGQPPLAGRADAMARLVAAWQSAHRGGGRVIDIRGEAGIGKTRLTLELAERATADGACVALSAAMDLTGAAPFGPWAELLRDIFRDLTPPTLDASWAALLGRLVPELGDDTPPQAAASPELDRARLFGGIMRLLEYAASQRPVLLVMEDVHLADLPSLQLIDYVGRRLAVLPMLIVLTRRDLPRRAEVEGLELRLRSRGVLADGVELGPLPDEDLTALVRSVAPMPDDDARRIAAAAEGNPLLAVESARAAGSGEAGLPEGIRGSVRAALGTLGSDALLVAEVAAVAGRPLERSELESLPVERVPDAVTEALDSGFVVADPARVGYRHALLREAAYADLPVPRRLWLHETFAGILQAGEARGGRRRAAEVARHLRLAGRDAIAVAHLARAAADARAVAALTEAAGYLIEAVGIATEDAALWLELAEVHAWRGDRAESDRCFDQVLSAGPLRESQAWLRRGRWMRGAMCFPRAALEAYRQVLRFPGISARERAEALAGSAWAEAVAGDAESVPALIEQVEALAEADSRPNLLVHDLASARTFALIRQGRFEQSYEPAAEAADAARRAGRPDMAYACWENASSAAACAGDFGRALDFADRGRAEVHGVLPTREVELIAARAHILARIDRPEEARAAAEEEVALADQLDRPDLSATARHDRGMVAFAARDFTTAEQYLAEALDADAPVSRPRARLTRAEALVRLGRLDDAERELRATVLEPLTPSDFPATLVPRLARIQGLVAIARGDKALAERRLTEAVEGWRRCSGGGLGDDYVATLTDLGRPPVEGLVEPTRELDQVLLELDALRAGASMT